MVTKTKKISRLRDNTDKISKTAVNAKFRTTILQGSKTATGIKVPVEIVEGLGAGKRPPVRVTIKGYTYRNTIAVMNGAFMIGVSAEHRKGAGVAGGDEVDVIIELDTQPRVAEVPEYFKKALDSNSIVKRNFDALSYSKKQWLLIPIKEAKTDETRQRRIEKAMILLNDGKI